MFKKLVISTIATGAIALSSLFGATTDASAATSKAVQYSATKYVYSGDGSLNMRSSATVNSKVVKTLKNGNKVKLSSKKVVNGTTWVYGTYTGKSGWMNAKYLSSKSKKSI